jgi:hypothetical protein
MYCEMVTESDGFPVNFPVMVGCSDHGCVPSLWSRPNLWLTAALIFCAVPYVARGSSVPLPCQSRCRFHRICDFNQPCGAKFWDFGSETYLSIIHRAIQVGKSAGRSGQRPSTSWADLTFSIAAQKSLNWFQYLCDMSTAGSRRENKVYR